MLEFGGHWVEDIAMLTLKIASQRMLPWGAEPSWDDLEGQKKNLAVISIVVVLLIGLGWDLNAYRMLTRPRNISTFPFFSRPFRFCRDSGVEDHIMVYERSLLVFLCIVFSIGVQLTRTQHWSHGWYPGGKRDIAFRGKFEVHQC